jgi:hypothetical protein
MSDSASPGIERYIGPGREYLPRRVEQRAELRWLTRPGENGEWEKRGDERTRFLYTGIRP